MKRKKRLVDRGSIPKENYPFPLMSKGERKNKCMETRERTDAETRGAMVTGGGWSQGEHEQEHECYHAINVSINSKGGYC
jgi:hypothetical protein